jgi:hypothetical protein
MSVETVKITVNGATTTLTSNGDGTYSGTLAAPNKTSYNINSGHYYPILVTATNKAGTSVTADDTDSTLGSKLRLFVKEVTAPTITITSPTSGQFLGTSTPSIKFDLVDESNGSGIAISSLSFKLDSTTYTNTSAGVTVTTITNGYSVTFIPTTALTDGSHTLSVNVSDNDGNAASSASVTFTTDTVAPTMSITSPTDNQYVSTQTLQVVGTVSDATSGTPNVTITLNGTSLGNVTVGSGGTFSKNVSLRSGANTIVITATDSAGKVTTITRTVTLDTSVPVIAAVNITPNPVNVGASYTVTITVE